MFDGNQRRDGNAYYAVLSYNVSDDNRWLAVAEDVKGDGQGRISLWDLQQQRWQAVTLADTSGDVVFAPDSHSLWYVENHPQTLTPYRVLQHQLGAKGADREIYREADGAFYVGIARSASDRWLLITASSNQSSEVQVLALDKPQAAPLSLAPRRPGVEVYADHIHDLFWLRSNRDSPGFALYTSEQSGGVWTPHAALPADGELDNFFLFDRWLVLAMRRNGKVSYQRSDYQGGQRETLRFPDASFMARSGNNPHSHSQQFNYLYAALDKPMGYWQWDLASNQTRRVHQKTVPGVDLSAYQSRYVEIDSRDGQKIPVSLIYRRDLFRPGHNPLLMYGYGAYGVSLDAAFSAPRTSLLDRGFVFALAHVRGGGEKGNDWYQQGKKGNKPNSFNDFIDASEGLVAQGFGDRSRLYAMGGSAGGLLVAAAINQAPTLFRAAVLQVPFVDVLNSISDASLPLTQGEYDEWGNPASAAEYRAIGGWSPYDNLRPQPYPSVLVTAGLHDSRVPYWEAAKYIARLRSVNRNPRAIQLLSTNLNAGHGGQSGRYARLDDTAQAFSFLIYIDNNKI